MISDSRRNNFNIIRFVASMMVVLGHMCHLIGVEVSFFLGQAVSTIGVKIFFLISGYLIAQSFVNDSNILRYMIRRIFRIIPGLVGVVLFAVFIVGPVFTTLSMREYFSHPMTWAYLKNIGLYIQYFLPGVFESNPYPNAINGSLWTLPVEVAMYIAVPIVFLLFRKFNKIKISLTLALMLETTSLLITYIKPNAFYVIYGTNVFAALDIVPYFFMGIVFTSPKIKQYLNLQLATGIMLLALMLRLSQIKSEIVLFIILSYFVFSFALTENPKFEKCFSQNDFSYGLYLYGFIVQQVVVKLLWEYQLTLNVYFVICACVTVVFGILSWYCIEKPAQRLAKKILKMEKIANLQVLTVNDVE